MAPRTLGDEDMKRIGEAIRQTREALGWTHAQLAEALETTPTNVYRMEGGGRGGLSLAMLFMLVRVMGCSWREVLGAEPGSDGGHSTDWEAGFRAGIGEAHALISQARQRVDHP